MRILIGIALAWFGGISYLRIRDAADFDALETLGGLVGMVLALIGLVGLVFGWGI